MNDQVNSMPAMKLSKEAMPGNPPPKWYHTLSTTP